MATEAFVRRHELLHPIGGVTALHQRRSQIVHLPGFWFVRMAPTILHGRWRQSLDFHRKETFRRGENRLDWNVQVAIGKIRTAGLEGQRRTKQKRSDSKETRQFGRKQEFHD